MRKCVRLSCEEFSEDDLIHAVVICRVNSEFLLGKNLAAPSRRVLVTPLIFLTINAIQQEVLLETRGIYSSGTF